MAWIHANAVFCSGVGIMPEIDAMKKFSNCSKVQSRAKISEAKKMRKSESEISIDIVGEL